MMRRPARLALLAAIALAAGTALFALNRALQAPVPPAPGPEPGVVIPDLVPQVSLADNNGTMRSLSEWDGKLRVINFWATWCAPCRREIPMLNALAQEQAAAGVEVIGIAIDFREEVLKYLETTPMSYTVLIGEQDGMDAARAFGMASIGLPFTAFADRQGRLVTIHLGELHRPQVDVILSAVRAVDRGDIDMETARDRIRAGLEAVPAGS